MIAIVISGLEALQKTDFSVISDCELINSPKMVQKCTVYKKIRKCQRNLFSTKLQVLK